MPATQATAGMDAVITALTSQLSIANLWSVVGGVIGLVGISVLFGLGFYLLKRAINKLKRAKGGI